jgi:predicted GIY-YIG superfamily endonuclease
MQFSEHRRYCVYILANRSKSLYVGVTNSLHRRVWQHKFGNGSEFCKRYKIDLLFITRALTMCATLSAARSGSRAGFGSRRFS